MDLVVPVKRETDELRYVLRSLEGMYDNLIVVGHKPKWLRGATHIGLIDMGYKYQNIANAIVRGLECVTGDFIIAEDDHVKNSLGPLPCYDRGYLKDVVNWQRERFSGHYLAGMMEAYKYFPNGKSYELHMPMVFNKNKLRYIFDTYKHPGAFQYRTFYGNHFRLNSKTVDDFKVRGDEDYRSWEFISWDDIDFPKIQPYLEARFPNPSRHE